MVLVQNWAFFPTFFVKYTPWKCVLWYSRTTNNFLGHKNKKFKSKKSDIFSKGLVHGFRPKLAIFPTFLGGNIENEM